MGIVDIRWHAKFILDVLWFVVRAVSICACAVFKNMLPRRCKNIENQTVLITGTARGLGRMLAFEFARHGSRVLCVDLNEKENRETVKMLNSNKCRAYTCDLTNPEAVNRLASSVLHDVGHVDIVVNNAGMVPPVSLREGCPEDIKRVVDINLMTHFWMLRAFLPSMLLRDSGHIVAVSSCAGLSALEYAGAYCATKFAVVGLMSAIEEEFRVEGITNIKFTTACPYFFDFNEGKCQHIRLRLPAMSPSYVAEQIVLGIRQELTLFTVHRYFAFLLGMMRLLPDKVQYMFRDVFYCKHDLNLIHQMTENRFNVAKVKDKVTDKFISQTNNNEQKFQVKIED